ncbi:fungal zn(2)-Cys(6) binuclear cluster domain-containing protein [Sarocladium implicatum]|nr:fungal zn(2)-Cys(6) binuclear cluster domain-containing protein [Sarocladium implicatum]
MSVDGPSELDLHDASDATGARKRRRLAISCARCRRRKIKCDQCVPCNNCQRARVDDCTYPETHTPAKRASRRVASKSPPRHGNPQLPLRYSEPRDRRAGNVAVSEHSTPASRQSRHLSNHSALAEHEPSRRRSVASPYSNPAALRAQIRNLEASLTALEQTQGSHKNDAQQVLTGPHFAHQSRWLNQTPLVSLGLSVLPRGLVSH